MVELWERQKGESSKSFAYFQLYRDFSEFDKTYKKYVEHLESLGTNGEIILDNGKKIDVPTLKRIEKLGSKWKWQERDRAYHNFNDELDRLKNNELFEQNNDSMINLVIDNIKLAQKHTDELEQSTYDYALSTRVKIGQQLAQTIDILNKNYRLSNGRSTNISESKQEVIAEIEAEAEVKQETSVNVTSNEFMDAQVELMRKYVNSTKPE